MKRTLTEYSSLRRYLQAFDKSNLTMLVLDGSPGVGKSTEAQCACPDAHRIDGAVSAFELYRELYRHRDDDFIIDDNDGICRDRSTVRLLKCLCDTRPTKTVAWHTAATQLDTEGIPREFPTNSRAILVTNDWTLLNQNVGALQDRGLVIYFKPTAQEVHAQVAAWAPDTAVYNFIGQHLPLIIEPSMRHYVEGAELKKAGLDWEQALLETWNVDSRVRVFLRLEHAPLKPAERVETFKRETGASRRTYFYIRSRIREARGGTPCTIAPASAQLWRNPISANSLENQQSIDRTGVVKVRAQ